MSTTHSCNPEHVAAARGRAERMQELVNTIGLRLESNEAGMVVLNIALGEAETALSAVKRELAATQRALVAVRKKGEILTQTVERDEDAVAESDYSIGEHLVTIESALRAVSSEQGKEASDE